MYNSCHAQCLKRQACKMIPPLYVSDEHSKTVTTRLPKNPLPQLFSWNPNLGMRWGGGMAGLVWLTACGSKGPWRKGNIKKEEYNFLVVVLFRSYLPLSSAGSVVEFLKKYCAIGSAWPGVDLRFCPWVLMFKFRTGGSYLGSSLCSLLTNSSQ